MQFQTELDFFDTAAFACPDYTSCATVDDAITIGDDDENLFNKLYKLVFDTSAERLRGVEFDDSTTNFTIVTPTASPSFMNTNASIMQHPQLLLSSFATNESVLSEQLPVNPTADANLVQDQEQLQGVVNQKETHHQMVEECKDIHGTLVQKHLLFHKAQRSGSIPKISMDSDLITSGFNTTLLSPFNSIYSTKFDDGKYNSSSASMLCKQG